MKYSIDWFNQNYPENLEIKQLVYKLHKLIEPPCGCLGKRLYNKIKHRLEIEQLEHEIEELVK